MKTEIINQKKSKILVAVIDWDGTISLLREGWQKVMQEFIANYISSGSPQKKDFDWAKNFIIKTLGENTIDQMLGIIEKSVKNKRKILAEKLRREYRDILEEKIRAKRIKQAKNNPDKFIVRGIAQFLEALKKRDIKILVFSGSEQNGKNGIGQEARILRLEHYFDGVFGYNGPVRPYNKDNVLKWVIKKYRIKDPSQILVVGDGPKEIKVGKKFGAITIGLMSKNITKEILIKSGADFVVYDSTDLVKCLKLLQK